jgi:hypothetical protein
MLDEQDNMQDQGEPDYGVHPVLVGGGAFGFADRMKIRFKR